MKQQFYQNLMIISVVCLGPLLTVQAVSPPPDGLYPGANVAEGGSGALFSLTTGSNNTAVGNEALFSLTTGHPQYRGRGPSVEEQHGRWKHRNRVSNAR